MKLKMNVPVVLDQIALAVSEAGGTAFLGGGAVRDAIMAGNGEFFPKDFDCELHGLTLPRVQEILSRFGTIKNVGEAFGVIKLRVGDDDFDFSLPRRESKQGKGHKGFVVEFDPTISLEEACSRRDLTINSALVNLATGELVDPFNARGDIEAKVLRHTSPAFVDDALRPLRVMQFSGRFGFTVAPETAELCKALVSKVKFVAQVNPDSDDEEIAISRVWGEFDKWALKSAKPSMGLRALVDMGWHVLFPEFAVLVGLVQEPDFHPEGSVDVHTGLTCDAAAEIAVRDGLSPEARRSLVFGALCHDFGKATTTEVIDGRITSRGHDKAGEAPAVSFLNRIGAPKALVAEVPKLVGGHMFHIGAELNDSNVRRLATRLAPETTIAMLSRVIEADHSGRAPLPKGNPCPELLVIAERLAVAASKPKPILTGKHLIDLGFKPGKQMGDLLKMAFEMQLAGHLANEEAAIAWASTHVAA
jgi:tRNA nucleotidyltransferase (CCA-adding enzyme)